jgi:glycosyltransferase involved in cell wall biosynthesis
VGGFGPHKNVGALLDSFAEIHNNSDLRVHLVLVGKTVGEVFHSEIQALLEHVGQLGLEDAVTFTGFVPDAQLVDLYNAAACLVMPSRDEGFGLPAVEAMACGTPVIASGVGALPELVSDASGLLVDMARRGALGEALGQLLTRNPAQIRELGSAGLRRAAELSWKKAASDLLAVFDELDPTNNHSAVRPSRSWGPCG